MSWGVAISGEYPKDWPEIAERVRIEVGHRCIRCGHPYKTGEHGKGEWTPCDLSCRHDGPFGLFTDGVIKEVNEGLATFARRDCWQVFAQWRILTVHHLSGQKSDCSWGNLLALCQRCHLQIQGRVNPENPYFLEHSDWFKPYAAYFYARKYLNQTLTREEVMARLDELLALERLA